MINFQIKKDLRLKEFIQILEKSGLVNRGPMANPDLLNRMLINSNLLIAARHQGQLVGILRGLTDFSYRTFVADLAIIRNFQNQGIGRGLLEEARKSVPDVRLFLFSAEDTEGFYQKKFGFQLHEPCYQLKPVEWLL
jgi:GNAT superfamily N-acetyltransferase